MKKMLKIAAYMLLAATAIGLMACDEAKDNDLSMLLLLGGKTSSSIINIAAIPGVTVPVRGATPVTEITETAQYTGTVSWSPDDNPFAATTVYTATISLVAKPGFTLTGVTADFFTVAGATSVANSADSGVVTAAFPATGSVPDVDVVFENAVQTGGTSETANSTGLTLTFDVDPTTLTVDNITVTGATKGVLSDSGTTRNLAISNITVANGATVSVTITSPAGYAISGSPKTAVVYRAPYVGMAYQGGIIAYILQSHDPGYIAGQTHGLIAATADQSTGIQWYNGSYIKTGATGTALGTGQANTTAIVNTQGAGSYAAQLCNDYVNADTGTGVYSDWFLPSIDELTWVIVNKNAIGGFTDGHYWSSSELGDDRFAWTMKFANEYINKNNYYVRVRAVRAF